MDIFVRFVAKIKGVKMIMAEPEISVIVANFNHADYIARAVDSISHQTFDNFEIIIVDDGSTDHSRDVIEEVVKTDERIQKPIYLSENKGKWFALNQAIETAQARLITQQDADDASCHYRLERQLKVLKATNSFHSLCGFTHCHSDEDIQKSILWKPEKDDKFDIIKPPEVTKLVLHGHQTEGINHYFMGYDYEVHSATALYFRQLHTHGMKYLPGGLGLRCQLAEDGDFNTKMTLLLQKTSVLREPLYAYLRHSSTNPAWKEPL